MNITVAFTRVAPGAKQPTYAHEDDAGLDLYALQDATLWHGVVTLVRTGIAIDIPPGWEGQVRPRSGLSLKGIMIVNAPGTIDPGYRSELKVAMMAQVYDYQVKAGDKIAQLIIAPVPRVILQEVDSLPAGRGGWGSTGA